MRFHQSALPLRRSLAFTLIELLAVLAIIAVLAGIIISVVGKVRSAAQRTQSIANVRTCSQSVLIYTSENRGRLPYKADPLDAGNSILSRTQMEPYLSWTNPAWFCPVVRRVQLDAGARVLNPAEDWIGRIRYNYNLISSNGYPATGWFSRSGRGARNTSGVDSRSIVTPSEALLFWNCDSGGRAGFNDGYAHVGMADGSVKRVRDESYRGVTSSAVRAGYISELSSGKMKGFDL